MAPLWMVSGNNGRIGRSGGKLCFLDMSDQKCQFLSFYALNIIHGLVSFQVWDTGVPIGGFPMGGVPMGGFPMGGVPMGGVPMGHHPLVSYFRNNRTGDFKLVGTCLPIVHGVASTN